MIYGNILASHGCLTGLNAKNIVLFDYWREQNSLNLNMFTRAVIIPYSFSTMPVF